MACGFIQLIGNMLSPVSRYDKVESHILPRDGYHHSHNGVDLVLPVCQVRLSEELQKLVDHTFVIQEDQVEQKS